MYELSFISLLALCMVSFIGVPHGSFDGAVAALLGYKTRKDFFFTCILIFNYFCRSDYILDLLFRNCFNFIHFNEYCSFWIV